MPNTATVKMKLRLEDLTKSRASILLAVLLLGALALGQSSTIPLVTASRAGCPIVLHGSLTATRKENASGYSFASFEAKILATNVSVKNIVLLITKMHATGLGIGEKITNINIHDYFFTSQVLEANRTEVFPETGPPVFEGVSVPRAVGRRATARADVVFVQFVDGSTWGDPEDGKEALRQRYLAWQKLKSLMKTLHTKGEQEFVSELMHPDEPGFLGDAHLNQVRSAYKNHHDDPKPAIEELERMLNAADSHERLLEQQ